jgi:anti-sigma-K factor RskA
MSDFHVTELTAAYALGALTRDDALEVERHCAVCPPCAADLAEMTGIASTLALASGRNEPPASLRRDILARARGERAAGEFLRSPGRRVPSAATPWWTAVAAAAFVAGIAMGAGALMDHQRSMSELAAMQQRLGAEQSLSTQLAARAREGDHMVAEIAAGRVWDMASGPPSHWWHCMVVQPPKQKPAMIVAMTPPAPRGMTYQGWVIHKGVVHDIGLIPAGKTSAMHLPMPVQAGDVVAFTMEPMSGSSRPTMPWVMAQTLD